jgi:hypothetical protein
MKMKSFNGYLTEKETKEEGYIMSWCFLQGQIPVSLEETIDWTKWKAPRGVRLDGGAWGISVIVQSDKGVSDVFQVDDIARFMRNEVELPAFLQAVYGKVS